MAEFVEISKPQKRLKILLANMRKASVKPGKKVAKKVGTPSSSNPFGGMKDMLHKVVAQNKYDIAPYVKYGVSRDKSGHAKHTKRK